MLWWVIRHTRSLQNGNRCSKMMGDESRHKMPGKSDIPGCYKVSRYAIKWWRREPGTKKWVNPAFHDVSKRKQI